MNKKNYTHFFSDEEQVRYSRHLRLKGFGEEAQYQLKKHAVLVIGAGGLGSPTLSYLAAAGVGKLGVVDFDVVDRSNLQRQLIHTTQDIGRKKTESTQETLYSINPNVEVVLYEKRLSSENALEMMSHYDLIVDGSDNFATRYLVNDAAILAGKPLVYGSIYEYTGQITLFGGEGEVPCYRCLFPEPPDPNTVPSCSEAGVLGVLPGIVGMMQATEAIKYLTGIGKTLAGRLLIYDALAMTFQEIQIKKDVSCKLCGQFPSINKLIDYEAFCNQTTPKTKIDMDWSNEIELNASTLSREWQKDKEIVFVDIREPEELEAYSVEGVSHIPMMRLMNDPTLVPKNQKVILFCKVGVRSLNTTIALREEGLSNVYSFKGTTFELNEILSNN